MKLDKMKWMIILICLVAVSGYMSLKNRSSMANEMKDNMALETKGGKVIVVDPGHGGFDPGKIGVNNALEKDINLAVSLKLKELLEKQGYEIVLTREADEALHAEGENGSKQEDMKRRVDVINEAKAVLAVSIHQNSFTQESSHGAQVFYHPQSEEGKKLALVMQETIKEMIADDNHREAKSNDSYYILRKTEGLVIIIECGFLSNYKEAELLITEDYQNKMAEAICAGLVKYLDNTESDE